MAGTRFDFALRSNEGSARALYDATVQYDAQSFSALVEITQATARIVEGGVGLDPVRAKQLEAIARTLGRRADEDSPWPRRIARWRQPGVR